MSKTCCGVDKAKRQAVHRHMSVAEIQDTRTKKNISNRIVNAQPWVKKATRPGVYRSDKRPLIKFPATIPAPAKIISNEILSTGNPEICVSNGLM